MIRPPRRAVTRFLIPFIDVLILLFCIFLLMPFVSRPDAGDQPLASTDGDAIRQLQSELKLANQRIDALSREKRSTFEHLRICVLEIDRDSGRLFAESDGGGREEIRDRAAARSLLARERRRVGAKSVGILLRYPRELTGFPLREQVEAYRTWFRDVPMAVDIPGRND